MRNNLKLSYIMTRVFNSWFEEFTCLYLKRCIEFNKCLFNVTKYIIKVSLSSPDINISKSINPLNG